MSNSSECARLGSLALIVVITTCVGCTQTHPNTGLNQAADEVPDTWLTFAEQTEFRETPRYELTIAYCRRLADASPWLRYESFGMSPEGRELPLLIASKDRAFTPKAAKRSGKLTVLVQNCIHAGECSGKDASMMLLRDIAVLKKRRSLLDHVNLLVIPILSVDGHERFSRYSRMNQDGPAEAGWRVTACNLNLNRDYVKADAAETRAWLKLWNAWQPDLHFDNHTTNGGDWQYDVSIDADIHATAAPSVARWLSELYFPELFARLETDGHYAQTYANFLDSTEPAKGIMSGGFGPRFSTGYTMTRNRPSVLVETHAHKPYRTRVMVVYHILARTLEMLNEDPSTLPAALREADRAAVSFGKAYDPDRTIPLAVTTNREEGTPHVFKGYAQRLEHSDISGTDRIFYDRTRPIDIDMVWYNKTEVSVSANPPLAYIVPPQWTEVIEVVEAHGLKTRRLAQPMSLEVESYRFSDVTFPRRSYEGRQLPRYTAERVTEVRDFRAGSVVIPLDQPDAKLAVHMFEPDGPDSFMKWGFFNVVFERKEYGGRAPLEEMAREMLAADPELRKEFEAKVAEDEEFAGNAWARLYFFYERSPWWDSKLNLYPVGRIVKPLPASVVWER